MAEETNTLAADLLKLIETHAPETLERAEWEIADRVVRMKCDGYSRAFPDGRIILTARPELGRENEMFGDHDDDQWVEMEIDLENAITVGDAADVRPICAWMRAMLDKIEAQYPDVATHA